MELSDYIRIFTGLFAIVNPVGTIPLFLAFTANSSVDRKVTARITATAVTIILVVSAFAGEWILSIFSISIDAFRVAGGILLMFMAFGMLQAQRNRTRHTPEEDAEAIDRDSVAVVPLAMPLMAGPGAIATMILFSNQMPGIQGQAALTGVCVAIGVSVFLVLRAAPIIDAYLSRTALNIMTRVMGLIMAAIAIEFIVGGLKVLLPGLAVS